MKRLFLSVFVMTVIFNILSLIILPDRVAIHFGGGGQPDSWGSKEINCLLFIGIESLIFILIWFSPTLMMKTPPSMINLPNKKYWLSDENKGATKQKLHSLMMEFGVAIMSFFLIVFLLTTSANLSEPVRLNESLFFAFLIVFLIYSVFWTIKLYRSFKLPKKQ